MRPRLLKVLGNMFGLDWRSLALLRMGLAVMVLCDLFVCVQSLRAFYSDEGVLPREVLIQNPLNPPTFSLHMLGGSVGFEAALLALEAVSAVLMLAGYRTRFATVLSYVLLCSRQARNPLLVYGADTALRVAFFWAMFLPLNRRYAADAARGRIPPPETSQYLGVPGFAYIVQILLIYVISGVLKSGPTWVVNYSAIYYALAIETYQRPLGRWLNQFDELNHWLTWAVRYVEIYGPALFVLPLARGWVRLFAFALFALLQIGFNVTMHMGLFGPVMVAITFALLPAEFWTHFAEPLGRRVRLRLKMLGWNTPAPSPDALGQTALVTSRHATTALPGWVAASGHRFGQPLCWVRDGVLLLLLTLVVWWNLGTLPGPPARLPAAAESLGWQLGLNQLFNLFTPNPDDMDGWFVMQAQLKNGRPINLFTGEPTVIADKPANVADTYPDPRWESLLVYLWYPEGQPFVRSFADYLARRWNDAHGENEQIVSFEIVFMEERVGPDHTKQPVNIRPLYLYSSNNYY